MSIFLRLLGITKATKIADRNAKIVLVTQFLTACYFTIPIWIVFYLERITIEQVAFLVAFQAVAQLVLELPTGAFADLIGKRASMVLSFTAYTIGIVLTIFSTNFLWLFFATFMEATADALDSGAREALLYDSFKDEGRVEDFAPATANISFWFQIGLGVSTLIGGFAYQVWNLLPFVLHGVFFAAAIWFSRQLIEPKNDTEKFDMKGYFTHMKEGVFEAFRSKEVALVSIFYVAVASLTWPNQIFFNSALLIELGFTPTQCGMITGVVRLLNIFVLSKLLSNKKIFTYTRSILFFPIVMLACYLPGVFFDGWWALPLYAGALMIGTARWILLTQYTNQMFRSKYRATAISALSMLVGILYSGFVFISGPIIDHYGGVKMVYTIIGVLTLIFVVPLAVKLVNAKRIVTQA